jgi:hypothetical protein
MEVRLHLRVGGGGDIYHQIYHSPLPFTFCGIFAMKYPLLIAGVWIASVFYQTPLLSCIHRKRLSTDLGRVVY